MWIFSNESKPDVSYCLAPSSSSPSVTSYTIGRFQSDIIESKDVSISRRHGRIDVWPVDDDDGGLCRPRVTLTDLKSSFGTYVGEEAILTSGNSSQADRLRGEQRLEDGVRVRFGLATTIFKLTWRPLVCTSSSLKDKAGLKRQLKELDSHSQLINDWTDQVTHLVMNEIILTLKVVNALAKGIPIVQPSFFTDLCNAVQTKQILPDVKNYLPPLKEQTLNPSQVSCHVDARRKFVFAGKTFVFSTKKQLAKFSAAIGYAGGRTVSSEKHGGLAPAEVAKGDAYIVVQPPPASQSQKQSQTDKSAERHFKEVVASLKQADMSMIPEQNIGLAVLKLSCDVDCNPRRKATVLRQSAGVLASQSHRLLAPETQAAAAGAGAADDLEKTWRIPETLTGPARTQASASASSGSGGRKNEVPPTPEEEDSERVRIPETLTPRPRSRAAAAAAIASAASTEDAGDTMMVVKQEVLSNTVKEEAESDAEATQQQRRTSNFKRPRPASSSDLAQPAAKAVKVEEEEEPVANGAMGGEDEDDEDEDLFSFGRNVRGRRSAPGRKESTDTPSERPGTRRSPRKGGKNESKKRRRIEDEGEDEDIPNANDRPPVEKRSCVTNASNEQSGEEEGELAQSTTKPDNRRRIEESDDEDEKMETEAGAEPTKNARSPEPAAPAKLGDLRTPSGFLCKSNVIRKKFDPSDTIPIEELTRSYCQLVVRPLVKRRPQAVYVPSKKPGDLERPVKNFKRFRKQRTNTSAIAGQVNLQVIEPASPRNAFDLFRRNEERENDPPPPSPPPTETEAAGATTPSTSKEQPRQQLDRRRGGGGGGAHVNTSNRDDDEDEEGFWNFEESQQLV